MKQADTARQVYHETIEPTLLGRQRFVRGELLQYVATHHTAPTAKELLRFVAARYPETEFDPNHVRPRLFELNEQGWVVKGMKRHCTVTGKCVYTWLPSTPTPPPTPGEHIQTEMRFR